MGLEALNHLEIKIKESVELNQRLCAENRDIVQQNRELQGCLEKCNHELEKSRAENEQFRQRYAPLAEKREQIRTQIEKMLARVDSVIS